MKFDGILVMGVDGLLKDLLNMNRTFVVVCCALCSPSALRLVVDNFAAVLQIANEEHSELLKDRSWP